MVHRYGKWIILVAICVGLAMTGCAAKHKPGIPSGLQADYDEAKRLFKEATDLGGKYCAPEEYAAAQAHMDWAERQWNERDWDDFSKAIAIAKQKSMEAIERCQPTVRPAEPKKPAPPEAAPEPEKPEARPAFAFAPAYFDAGKADIRSDAIVVLDRIGMILKKHPWLKVEVAGHTDAGGSEEANMELSLKRAKSVATYVMDHYAISPHRLKVVGFGESKPVANNSTLEGRRMNRRAEFRTIEE